MPSSSKSGAMKFLSGLALVTVPAAIFTSGVVLTYGYASGLIFSIGEDGKPVNPNRLFYLDDRDLHIKEVKERFPELTFFQMWKNGTNFEIETAILLTGSHLGKKVVNEPLNTILVTAR